MSPFRSCAKAGRSVEDKVEGVILFLDRHYEGSFRFFLIFLGNLPGIAVGQLPELSGRERHLVLPGRHPRSVAIETDLILPLGIHQAGAFIADLTPGLDLRGRKVDHSTPERGPIGELDLAL